MFAYVPTVPGTVISVVTVLHDPLPDGQTSNQYYPCGSIVVAGWNFDGNAFTPSAPSVSVSIPTAAQNAESSGASFLAQGVAITSTGTPSLNGTYPLSQETLNLIADTVVGINESGGFPNGEATFPWADVTGTEHAFTSVASFKEFAIAVENYAAPILEYISSGGTAGALPTSNAVTIA